MSILEMQEAPYVYWNKKIASGNFVHTDLSDDRLARFFIHTGSNQHHLLLIQLAKLIPLERWKTTRFRANENIFHIILYGFQSKEQRLEIWNLFWNMPGMKEVAKEKSDYGTTLQYAIGALDLAETKMLLELGLNVNEKCSEEGVHLAIYRYHDFNHPEVLANLRKLLEILIKYGLDWNLKNGKGTTALEQISSCKCEKLFEGLLPKK